MGYGRAALGDRRSTHRTGAVIVIAVATALILIPLVGTAINVGRDSALEASVDTEATRALRGTALQLYSITSSNGKVEVVVAGDQTRGSGAADRLA